jgi:hypothetical protein
MQDKDRVADQSTAHERKPALAELTDSASLLLDSYKQIAEATLHLLGAKLKANAQTLCIGLGVILFAAVLAVAVWVCAQVLVVYALNYAGLNLFLSAGLVLGINFAAVIYLILTGLKLFDHSIDSLTSGFFSEFVQKDKNDD